MNLPGDYVHHVEGGFGWLLFPWFGLWVIWFKGSRSGLPRGFRLMDDWFHNCTSSGVY